MSLHSILTTFPCFLTRVHFWPWQQNVDKLCDFVFTREQRSQLLFEWDQNTCVKVEPHPDPTENKPLFEKHLSRVWKEFPQYDKNNTIIFDDSLLKMRHNPSECVFIPDSWIVTQENDDELSPNGGLIFQRLRPAT